MGVQFRWDDRRNEADITMGVQLSWDEHRACMKREPRTMGVQLSWDEHRACMKRERGERKACKRLRILADSPRGS